MNVLITGATGFVGRNLLKVIEAESMRKQHRFLLLSSARHERWDVLVDRREQGCYSFTVDDVRACGFPHIDGVIHAGAFTPKRGTDANDVDGAVANIINTDYLAKQFGNMLRRFVFASTLDVYELSPRAITEETRCAPTGLYGKSKLFCEAMLASRFGMGEDVSQPAPLQVLRLGHIYGCGEDAYEKFIPTTIRNLIEGKPPVLYSDGAELRSFLHVSDCCRMVLKGLELTDAPGPINIVSRHGVPIREIANILCTIHQQETGEQLEPEIQGRAVQTRDYVFDATKMERYLGRETVNIVDGLRDEYRYFRARHANIP
jgi:UDP-glucose 4-epimerase